MNVSFSAASCNINNKKSNENGSNSLTLHCGAMAIFPTYLTTSFINKFCSPPLNQYSPFPTIEVRRNKMVQWMKIKCVTLRSHPPVVFFFWLFPIKTERNNTRRPPRKERDRKAKRQRETERFLEWRGHETDSYSITINEFGRLHVSISPLIYFLR